MWRKSAEQMARSFVRCKKNRAHGQLPKTPLLLFRGVGGLFRRRNRIGKDNLGQAILVGGSGGWRSLKRAGPKTK